MTGKLRLAVPKDTYSGTLSGSLRVAFDVSGTQILKGSAAIGLKPELVNEFPCG